MTKRFEIEPIDPGYFCLFLHISSILKMRNPKKFTALDEVAISLSVQGAMQKIYDDYEDKYKTVTTRLTALMSIPYGKAKAISRAVYSIDNALIRPDDAKGGFFISEIMVGAGAIAALNVPPYDFEKAAFVAAIEKLRQCKAIDTAELINDAPRLEAMADQLLDIEKALWKNRRRRSPRQLFTALSSPRTN